MYSYEREVLAVVYFVPKFRYNVWVKISSLITDCKAMKWLATTAEHLRK
jgi:hypothetical protein